MEKYYFGVDIGGTATKFGVFNHSGVLVDKWEIPSDRTDGASHLLPSVAAEIERYASGTENVLSVGVGIPGPVQHGGHVTRCVNLGLADINPARELAALLHGVPVFAANDANMAALGEYWKGGGNGARSLILITLGTGVGGGIIIDGRMIYGEGGLGGEFGHVVVDPDETFPCNCGQYGCLDQIASATGIVRYARNMLAEREDASVLRSLETITARDVVDAAKAGDALAAAAFDRCMYFLGKSMAMLTNTLDPETFIIGGGVSRAGEYLLDTVRRHYDALPTLFGRKAQIGLAQLGNDAGIYGAAKLAMDSVR
ncbi:MAG: ROK family glucokinase [Clostridia bacterium]|nr:ROK family glucokinase [Clostridia bacterium]